jgi:hypothetical protein
MAIDPEKALDENATSAQSVSTPDGGVVSQDLNAQIKWANRKLAMQAAQRGGNGLFVQQIKGRDCVNG